MGFEKSKFIKVTIFGVPGGPSMHGFKSVYPATGGYLSRIFNPNKLFARIC